MPQCACGAPTYSSRSNCKRCEACQLLARREQNSAAAKKPAGVLSTRLRVRKHWESKGRNARRGRRSEVAGTLEYRAKKRQYRRDREVRSKGLPSHFPGWAWLELQQVYQGRCAYCGCSPTELTQDHVVPLSSPDSPGHVIDNVVPACRECNGSKGVHDWPARVERPDPVPRDHVEFLARLGLPTD